MISIKEVIENIHFRRYVRECSISKIKKMKGAYKCYMNDIKVGIEKNKDPSDIIIMVLDRPNTHIMGYSNTKLLDIASKRSDCYELNLYLIKRELKISGEFCIHELSEIVVKENIAYIKKYIDNITKLYQSHIDCVTDVFSKM